MSDACYAITVDAVERAAGGFDPIVIATNRWDIGDSFGAIPALVDIDQGQFHFGHRLQGLVRRYQPQSVLYLGAGSGPLLTSQDFAKIGRDLVSSQDVVIVNNFYSADIFGFTPATSLLGIEPPSSDNDVAYRLANQAGLLPIRLPRGTATLFDIDTPTDLAILRLHPGIGPRARRFLEGAPLDSIQLDKILPILRDSHSQVVVVGRVGQAAWARIEPDFSCGVRVYSEERGMRASGRQERGEVRSLVGYMLEDLGPSRFFRRLRELGDAILMDSRVVFSHCGWEPSPADRFYSDLLQPEAISHPQLAEFTFAARDVGVPVLLGGHSLVAGGLWALADILHSNPSNQETTSRV